MRFKKTNEAFLEGYIGPIYPPNIDELNKIEEKNKLAANAWQEALRKVSGFAGICSEKNSITKDNYGWWRSVTVFKNGNEIRVFFPWALREKQLDRSIAIYAKNEIGDQEAREIIDECKSILGIAIIKTHMDEFLSVCGKNGVGSEDVEEVFAGLKSVAAKNMQRTISKLT